MMKDYDSLLVSDLRKEAQRKGMTGVEALYTKKPALVHFLKTKTRFPVTLEQSGDTVSISRLEMPASEFRDIAMSFLGISETTKAECQKRQRSGRVAGGKVGRPAPPIPEDIETLLITINCKYQERNPFSLTGKSGVYARRSELPEQWQGIGRDRIEAKDAELVASGVIVPIKGKLSIPGT